MVRRPHHQPWVVILLGWSAVFLLLMHALTARAQTATRGNVTVMFLFQESGEAGIQAVDNTLTRAFERRGYRVLDRDSVAQLLRRDADLLQLYDLELTVRVDKQTDLAFKRALLSRLAELGLEGFTTVAREGETVYLRRTGTTGVPVPLPPNHRVMSPTDGGTLLRDV